MLMVERMPRTGFVLLTLLVLAPARPARAQEPTIIRVSGAVGDTIDVAERDCFQLFPNTACFQHAVILELPKPELWAEVALTGKDSSRHIFYRLAPSQLERIRYLIDNHDLVAAQVESDSGAGQALAAFWKELEEHPFESTAGEPAVEARRSVPAQPATNCDNRLTCAATGATLGSVAGGCIGAYAGYSLVTPGHYEETECCAFYVPPLYHVDLPCILGASIGATAAAGVAGYAFGAAEDRKPAPVQLEGEGTEWRTNCAGIGVLPAIALGIITGAVVRGTIFGRERDWDSNIDNDPDGWSALPAVLTGLCVSVEVITISYHIGRTLDRQKAKEAEARRRELGR